MRFLSKFLLVVGLIIATTVVAQQAEAQSKADVVKAFNAAFKLAQNGQNKEAIQKFEDCIQLANKVGKSAEDIKQKAQEQLPPLNYKLAADYYRNKDIDGAIQQFEKTYQVAQKYGNKQIAERSKMNVPKLYYYEGTTDYQKGDYNAALKAYDNAIQREPQYAKAFYQKGLCYMKLDKGTDATHLDEALKMWDQAISIGTKVKDSGTVRRAKSAASSFLVYKGANANKAKKYDLGIKFLKRSLNYDNSNPNAYYRLAQAYNNKGEYRSAVSNGKLSLKYEKGGKTDKAKIWYEIGTAYKYLKEKSNACNAFQNAAYGNFKASADHQMKYEVKCDQASASN